MRRLSLSAVYVGANLLVSLVIVILIARSTDDQGRTAFFLFQALFFPLTTLLAQSQMLIRFRGGELGRLGIGIDTLVFAGTMGALLGLGPRLFTVGEAVLFAASVPFTYRGTNLIAGLQFDESRAIFALVPAGTAALRLIACIVVLPLGAAPAFLAAAATYLAVPLIVDLRRRRRRQPADRQLARLADLLTLFAFFLCASFTFQWERMVFARSGLEELIAASGVCMTWMLSPLSAIFATLYRADARAIFAGAGGVFRRDTYLRRAGVFAGLAAGYLLAAALSWHPLNELLFPFFSGPVIWPLLLGAAIVLDRLAQLAVFTGNRLALYRQAAAAKLVLIAAGIAIVIAIGAGLTLTIVYAIYLGLSVAYLGIALALAAAHRPSAAGPTATP